MQQELRGYSGTKYALYLEAAFSTTQTCTSFNHSCTKTVLRRPYLHIMLTVSTHFPETFLNNTKKKMEGVSNPAVNLRF